VKASALKAYKQTEYHPACHLLLLAETFKVFALSRFTGIRRILVTVSLMVKNVN